MNITTNYKEIVNEEKQGLELYFEAIPTKSERQQLKNNGYRWNNNKKCWYIKTTKENGKKAKKCNIDIKGLKLNELIELTEAEKEKFCNDVWNWGGNKWKNEQLQKHYFFKTKDNFIMAIENEKYKSISKDLWFDDEQEIPEKTKALFINYNTRLHCDDYNEQNYYYFMQNYFEKFPNVVYVRSTRSFIDHETEQQQKYYKRDLTDAEKKDFLNIKKLIHTKYVERLNNYFEKYGQRFVHCRGYWVNR